MTTDLIVGAVALGVIALGLLIWFAYRAGSNKARVSTSDSAKTSADRQTQKSEAMAQAQADKPATADAVLKRLEEGVGVRWFVLGILPALCACTSVRYVPCPTLVTYSATDQRALAAEMRANPQPQTMRWIGDYIGLRDQVRACRK